MSRYYATEDEHENEPLMWLGGQPIYATYLIILVYVASMFAATLLGIFGLSSVLGWLLFDSTAVLHGQVWRIVTYGLVNPPVTTDQTIAFAVDMLILFWFGREVEKFFGRTKFLFLYSGIYLVTPLLFTALGKWLPLVRVGETGALAVFIAFATLYPNAVLMFDVLAKWAALIFVGIFSLVALYNRDLSGLLALWVTSGFAFGYVRYQQGHFTLPSFRLPKRKPQLRVLPDLPAKPTASAKPKDEATMAEVDALLDKIARSGLSSLTAKERARLEQGRAKMLRKGPGRE